MEHIDLILPTLRKFIHKILNDIATCIHRDEGQFKEMYDEIRAIWKLNVKQSDDACAVLLWYVLKSLEEWIPNEDFVCGWSEALRLHEAEIADEDPDSDSDVSFRPMEFAIHMHFFQECLRKSRSDGTSSSIRTFCA